jgi:hypothetical protein
VGFGWGRPCFLHPPLPCSLCPPSHPPIHPPPWAPHPRPPSHTPTRLIHGRRVFYVPVVHLQRALRQVLHKPRVAEEGFESQALGGLALEQACVCVGRKGGWGVGGWGVLLAPSTRGVFPHFTAALVRSGSTPCSCCCVLDTWGLACSAASILLPPPHPPTPTPTTHTYLR